MKSKKLITISVVSIASLVIYIIFSFNNYKSSLKEFNNLLTSSGYNDAYLIINKRTFNPFINANLHNDTNDILHNYLEKLNNDFKSGKLSEEDFLKELNNLEVFKPIDSEIVSLKENLPSIKESKENFEKGKALYNDKNYTEALNYFDKVNSFSPSYAEAISYKENIVFSEADNYVNKKQYTKAINLIENNLDKLNHDEKALNKLEALEKLRMDYLAEYSKKEVAKQTSITKPITAFYNKLNKDTINSFDITSETNHLVFVNIAEQKTYIFIGSKNNWKLSKEFICSTGIEGKETLVGVFTVQFRAPWFFSPKYGQGGKNYVSFDEKGNYLFHSIPFENDQRTVSDPELGKPASHGCIRLSVEDSKWLYDNVQNGSKIIIY